MMGREMEGGDLVKVRFYVSMTEIMDGLRVRDQKAQTFRLL